MARHSPLGLWDWFGERWEVLGFFVLGGPGLFLIRWLDGVCPIFALGGRT